MSSNPSTTAIITLLVDRLAAGDLTARDELVARSCQRLEDMARHQLARYPAVRRFEQTGDVAQLTTMRLRTALESVTPHSAREFFALSAKKLREQLIDLHRHYYGPQGEGANRATNAGCESGVALVDQAVAPTEDPIRSIEWAEFHRRVETLPPEEREVIDLFWYQSLSRAEVALAIGVSEKTISRRWRDLRLKLADWLTP